MSAHDLLQALSSALFLLLGVVTCRNALTHPRRFSVDTALFFGSAAVIILLGAAAGLIGHPLVGLDDVAEVVLMALPYLLLRLVDDFAGLPNWVMGGALVGLALAVVAIVVAPPPMPLWIVALLVIYFFGLAVYATTVVIREARRTDGVTRRRLQAIACGSLLLGLTILASGLGSFAPAFSGAWTVLSLTGGLATGLAYFLGFAPPAALRRAWQEPELRMFLADAARLAQLPETGEILHALEQGAAAALGVETALIGVWDETTQRLRFDTWGDGTLTVEAGDMLGGRAFAEQQAIFSANAARDDPANAERYRSGKATAVLAAPITAGVQRLGVLVAYAAQPPVFAEDDLALMELLARQAAVILDYVRLYEASRLRAEEVEALYEAAKQAEQEREQLRQAQLARAEAEAAVRARDEFLFVAAHELRTPITSLRGFVQILLRQLDRGDALSPRRLTEALRTIDQQSEKMTGLIAQLLDVSRLSTSKLALELRLVDITALTAGVVQALARRTDRHTFNLEAPPALLASVDPFRFEQVVVNLLDNAIKYSPDGGVIAVELNAGPLGGVLLSVRDHGIGIPPERRDHIFDRFYQAHPTEFYGGMGLGLYITREIVGLHGGRIAATYPEDGGVRFTVTLPAATGEEAADVA